MAEIFVALVVWFIIKTIQTTTKNNNVKGIAKKVKDAIEQDEFVGALNELLIKKDEVQAPYSDAMTLKHSEMKLAEQTISSNGMSAMQTTLRTTIEDRLIRNEYISPEGVDECHDDYMPMSTDEEWDAYGEEEQKSAYVFPAANRETLIQAVVMNEILQKPSERKRKRFGV